MDVVTILIATLLLSDSTIRTSCLEDKCVSYHEESPTNSKRTNSIASSVPRYILYDVNAPEGFNLRRDVFMRMAIFVRSLADSGDWHLVLPSWTHLYHWKSPFTQNHIPWSQYFDLPSLQKFAPVIETSQFFQEYGSKPLDAVYILQNFKNAWKGDFKWEEKWIFENCSSRNSFSRDGDGLYHGDVWGYDNITAFEVKCVSFQGQVKQLKELLELNRDRAVLIDHAEIALHNHFGNREYWRCRRSMRFAKHLEEVAKYFRATFLNSTDESDGINRPDDWTQEKPLRNAKGGPYFCAHLRRRDFLMGRPNLVPNFENAASQIRKYQKSYTDVETIFISTDASQEELTELKSSFQDFNIVKYEPSPNEIKKFKDGGIAIIDQIICSHARLFVGTCESTFSFRIQEEREIIGFNPETTFNCFCGNNVTDCTQPSKWLIVH